MSGAPGGHGLAGFADAAAFLARLTRLDPAALVRLRSDPAGTRTGLWARLPWAVLVGRTVAGAGPGDATVAAAQLLAEVGAGGPELPARRDADWRWPLPPSSARVVETIAAAEVHRIAVAAAETLRSATTEGLRGRAVGQRVLRDALLDHVAIVVTEPAAEAGDGGSRSGLRPIEIPQRLVQAVVRMGFLGAGATAPDEQVQVRVAGRWVGLSAPYGVAWLPAADPLMIQTDLHPPKG